jgi:cytochrome c biogenesis protein CcmG, thiol:disulfide interchange protein DsbE
MKRKVAGLALALSCLLLAAAAPSKTKDGGGANGRAGLLAVGDPAPDWTLRDAEGRAHTLAEYRGRVVVLDFWATWCALCSKVMPRMEKLHRKYRGQGVAVFGVSSFETGDPAALMKKKNCTYGLLLKGEEIAPAYGVETLPVVCVIGPDGRVVYSHAGADHKNLESVVEKLVKSQGT